MREKDAIPFNKWKSIYMPIVYGGEKLKDSSLFAQALVAESVWGLIPSARLWQEVVTKIYMHLVSLLEWIINPCKLAQGASFFLRVMIRVYPLIGKFLTWTIGNGRSIML